MNYSHDTEYRRPHHYHTQFSPSCTHSVFFKWSFKLRRARLSVKHYTLAPITFISMVSEINQLHHCSRAHPHPTIIHSYFRAVMRPLSYPPPPLLPPGNALQVDAQLRSTDTDLFCARAHQTLIPHTYNYNHMWTCAGGGGGVGDHTTTHMARMCGSICARAGSVIAVVQFVDKTTLQLGRSDNESICH